MVRQLTNRISKRVDTRISIKSVDIGFFNKVILNEVLVEDQHQDTLVYVDRLVASIDSLQFRKRKVVLSALELKDTKLFLSLDEKHLPNYKFLLDSLRTPKKNENVWGFFCHDFIFSNTQLAYSYYKMKEARVIDLRDIQLDVTNLVMNRDSIAFNVNKLSLDDKKSFSLNELSTRFTSYKHLIKLQDLKLLTPRSKIVSADFLLDQTPMLDGKDFSFSELDLNVKESSIHFTDLAQFVPSLKGMDLEMSLSGHVYGTIADLKAKQLAFGFGKNTKMVCDFYVNGLPNIEKSYIMLDLKNSSTDFTDLMNVRLPESMGGNFLDFPDFLKEAGIIQYKGSFTGFTSDFVAYGTVNSNFGRLTTDLSFVPSNDDLLSVEGHLKTVNFKLGEFARLKKVGPITFNGQIDGDYSSKDKKFAATIDGVVDSLDYNNYKFKNLVLDGNIQDQKFEGDLKIDDPNLMAVFNGKLDFNPEIPVFDFELLLKKADLVALHLDETHEQSKLAVDLKAKFSGNSIDNLNGSIWFDEGSYENENNQFNLNSLSLETSRDSLSHLQILSDFVDLKIDGDYSFRTIHQSLKNMIHKYLPSSGIKFQEIAGQNAFDFSLSIKDVEPITNTFSPELYVSPATAEGRFDEKGAGLEVKATFPRVEYRNLTFNDYNLTIRSGENIEVISRLGELEMGGTQKIYNLSLLAEAFDNELKSRLIWNNYHQVTYSGELETITKFQHQKGQRPHVELSVLPSKIYVADTLWLVHPAKVTIDTTTIHVADFQISHDDQTFVLEGAISKDKSDRLNVAINNFDLGVVNQISDKDIRLKGTMNGTTSVFDIYEKALFLSDLKIDGFTFRDQEVGDISVVSKWDRVSEAIQSELVVNDHDRKSLNAFGTYKPKTDSVEFYVNLNNLSTAVLQPVLEKTFKNIHGNATGNARIYGTPGKILIDGDVYGLNAGLTIKNLQVAYYFSDTVRFAADSIIFDKIKIYDYAGNSGLFDGSIRHDNFKNMDYDMTLSSSKILALNTTIRDNERFYGTAYANGLMSITGHGRDINLDVIASPRNGTALNISLDYEEDVPVYDFIRFVSDEKTTDNPIVRKNDYNDSRLSMSFDLDITPEAKMQLIYNSQIGDVIKAQGNGSMQVNIDPDFNISMYGNYRVDRGDYLFTLQNVINKKFEIEQGGTMTWNGDPYEAIIDINAIYRLKASLYELFANTYENIDYTQRIPVLCKIALTEDLMNPNIDFDIEFPSAEDRIKDEVRQFFNTDEDMNKQILSLLVLGRFYTPEYLRGTYEATNTNLVGTTASELFSNQLSNWLSQISNDFDIGVNYRPGNQITNDEIELALSTQIFNDRVTLNGNIGNNGTQAATANNNNIIGDFDLNVKLTNNGKLQFKAYNHSNNNIIYETSPYTQGVGFSYRENYDNFGELWQKFKRLFHKRNEQ
ncbi:translocation/assembly module TamB domain-containing protein [Sunxiuqinia sp. A32]|uniref:translocation/assembly module TamB domain-containing protein n=1 Tax=Sunxiuqinia sp. A32 TaxID=3461496 RepID=UPI00404570A4